MKRKRTIYRGGHKTVEYVNDALNKSLKVEKEKAPVEKEKKSDAGKS